MRQERSLAGPARFTFEIMLVSEKVGMGMRNGSYTSAREMHHQIKSTSW